jgi:ornithine cyclodeaminase/alanine dehydrogenase-like protein (mu-crystallin family)
MIHVDSNTIGTTAPIKDWIQAMEKAFRDTADGKVEVPKRTHINRGENALIIMPCFGQDFFSTKLVSVFPRNLVKQKPVINGTVLLNDSTTGEPLAALEGSKLTAMRTAAVGSVGIRHLAPKNSAKLGVIGLGIQGFHQALFACQERPIRELRILDRSKAIMDRFGERFSAFYKKVKVIQCRNAEELCNHSEIIITATGSHRPVVPWRGGWWKGKTLIGIGSYKPEMREFPDALMKDLDKIFVDTMHGLTEAGDLVGPMNRGIVKRENIYPLSDLITGKIENHDETRFFKSVGMAAFDLYGAMLVYKNL